MRKAQSGAAPGDPASLMGKRRLDERAAIYKAHMQQTIACTLVKAQARVVYKAVALGYARSGLHGDIPERDLQEACRDTGRIGPFNGEWAAAYDETMFVTMGPPGFCRRGR